METKKNAALALLIGVQYQLKAPKNQTGNGIRYKYRNAEQIYEAAKPLCKDAGLFIYCTDDLVMVGERYYIKATASVVDVATGDMVSATGWAREPEVLASMGAGQITGTSSSYARKYALCGLFAVDGSEDEDELAARGEDVTHRPENGKGDNNTNTQPKTAQNTVYGQKNGSANGGRNYYLNMIAQQMTQKCVQADEVKAIIKARYGKSDSNYMKISELKELAENFDAIVLEHSRQAAK